MLYNLTTKRCYRLHSNHMFSISLGAVTNVRIHARMVNFKVCSNLVTTGLKLCSNASQIAVRNFHIMTRPIPQQITALPSPMQSQLIGSNIMRLLTPINSLVAQVAGFKVKGHLKRRCKDCYYVIRQRRHYIICPTHPRHKQMSMKKRDYKTWILTDATQSKVRPF